MTMTNTVTAKESVDGWGEDRILVHLGKIVIKVEPTEPAGWYVLHYWGTEERHGYWEGFPVKGDTPLDVYVPLAANKLLINQFKDLDQRIREQSKPLADLLNIVSKGEAPNEQQIRAAVEAYKWAVYGTAIAAQIVVGL